MSLFRVTCRHAFKGEKIDLNFDISEVLVEIPYGQSAYSGFSGKAPGGGVFIFASLKLNQEKTPSLETSFYWL